MRAIPEGLGASLEAGATTLCHCWRLTCRDGRVLGFTDHDRDLAFEGAAFAARSGLEAADAAAELGFAVGGGEVSGALVSADIAEADLAAGVYDDACVETWLVDWSDPADRLLLSVGTLGEIRRGDGAFVAEVRGAMHRLDETRGRLFRATCSADLGDGRCRADLAGYRAVGTVAATDGTAGLASPGLAGFADGWFTGGRLTWSGGASAGLACEVRDHRLAAVPELVLWPLARPIAVGDAFTVTAGCDKRFATCGAKFANVVNFQGFPHMPGNDFAVRRVAEGEPGLDGGSLYR